ncbi:hypothetical protein HK097_010468 [Rhizophlyctis rosea]|uniref:Uncharacterized protein n=1 Tax=Rhizophlyctis rosea TaxID=64517 RepID=A0AAD5S7I9_9FUNG|nr:hypothetical protein HK097_010468 [Rhizophlyctis rosea]
MQNKDFSILKIATIILGIVVPLPLLITILYRWRHELTNLNTFRKYIIIVLFSVLLSPLAGTYKVLLDAICASQENGCVDTIYTQAESIGYMASYIISYGFIHLAAIFYLLTVIHRLQIFSPLLKLPRFLLPILKYTSIILGIAGWSEAE